jgi:hypothetical protein
MLSRSFDAPIRVQRQYGLARRYFDNCGISGIRFLLAVNVAQREFFVRRFAGGYFVSMNQNDKTTNA